MMKKLLLALAGIIILASCGGGKDKPEKKGINLVGTWQLTSVATKASVGSVTVDVYVTFDASNFTLYQKIGDGRYSKFTGTYTLTNAVLSGQYTGGSAWGAVYDVEQDGDTLTLSPQGGNEKDTYKKVSSVPSSVTDNIY